MRSYFVTGTDTGVGKTVFVAGLARAAHGRGIDVGVMKPLAAGVAQQGGFCSQDAQMLVEAACVDDGEDLVNPQFFAIEASPYTAARETGATVDLDLVKRRFAALSSRHSCMLVEGIGGIMVPIRRRYYIADLIVDMGLEAIIVAGNRIGSINHTIMTIDACGKNSVPVRGLVISCSDPHGYPARQMLGDLRSLTDIDILGTIPRLSDPSIDEMAGAVARAIDIDSL